MLTEAEQQLRHHHAVESQQHAREHLMQPLSASVAGTSVQILQTACISFST